MLKNLFFIFVSVSTVCFSQIMGPKISVPVSTHDFGVIKQGDTVKYDFMVVNAGDDLLKISNVRASCGCTAAIPEKKEIAPGESTKLKVEFNSTGKKGNQVKHINISSNDPKTPEMDLIITANVLEPGSALPGNKLPKISFTETKHDFGTVNEGVKAEYSFSFENTGKGILEIKSVNSSCGCTAALASTNVLMPGEKGNIKVEFDTSNKQGKTSKTIAVSTNDPDEPNKILIISADIIKTGNK